MSLPGRPKRTARRWHESPAYEALAALRVDAAETDLVLARGLR